MMIVLIGENIANDGFFMMLLMMSRRTLSTWTLPSLSGDDDDDDDDNDDDDDDNDDEDDYSRFRVFGHNSPKNIFLGLKPKNELFLCKNTTFLLNKFFSRMKLKF